MPRRASVLLDERRSRSCCSTVVEGLRPLLELPVEHVVATHGGPTDRAALGRALS
jgi:hypothetical protein